jgi:hypothetical protein
MSQQAGVTGIGEKIDENSDVAIADFIKKNTRVIANGLIKDEKIISLHQEKSTGEYYSVQIGMFSHNMQLFKVNLYQAKLVHDLSPNKYTESITSEKEIANIVGVNDHMEQIDKSVDSQNTLSR